MFLWFGDVRESDDKTVDGRRWSSPVVAVEVNVSIQKIDTAKAFPIIEFLWKAIHDSSNLMTQEYFKSCGLKK